MEGGPTCSFFIGEDREIWGCGSNYEGQLNGDNLLKKVLYPSLIPSLSKRLSQISAGPKNCIGLSDQGQVYTWGLDNNFGQLGVKNLDSTSPYLQPLENIENVSCGGSHSLACDGNRVWSWGNNYSKQLGRIQSPFPECIKELSNIQFVSAGEKHSIALESNESVWSWGENSLFQTGLSCPDSVALPTKLDNLPPMYKINTKKHHSLGIDRDGFVWNWGGNSNQSSPQKIANLCNIQQVSCGYNHSIILDENYEVFEWKKASLEKVSTLSNIDFISAGGYHSLALDKKGKVWAWGQNEHGQLGTGDTTCYSTPQELHLEVSIQRKQARTKSARNVIV